MKHLALVLLVGLTLTACQKQSREAIVGIIVTNEDGIPIQNCNVKLNVPSVPETEWGVNFYYGTTDIDGYIEFKSTVNAYFDVYLWKGLWEGCGFVEFDPGKKNQKTIIIYPPNTPFNGCF